MSIVLFLSMSADDLGDSVGRSAGNSGQHPVSPAPMQDSRSSGDGRDEPGSRERMDRPAAYPTPAPGELEHSGSGVPECEPSPGAGHTAS